jgi:hypothetical protein
VGVLTAGVAAGITRSAKTVRTAGDDITYHSILHPPTHDKTRVRGPFDYPQTRAGWGFPAVLKGFARRSIETWRRALTPSHASPIIRPHREQLIA